MDTFSVATSAELLHHRQILSARPEARLLTQLNAIRLRTHQPPAASLGTSEPIDTLLTANHQSSEKVYDGAGVPKRDGMTVGARCSHLQGNQSHSDRDSLTPAFEAWYSQLWSYTMRIRC